MNTTSRSNPSGRSSAWLGRCATPLRFHSFLLACLAFVYQSSDAASAPSLASAPRAITNLLAPGSRFATEYFIRDTGAAGPTVMIVGGMHGNEPAGAVAAETIRHWPITRGRIVVLPRANVPALAANKRLIPGLVTNLNNLNRNFPRAGQPEPPRGELAAAIWELALKQKPDWLLDLHEGYDFNGVNAKSSAARSLSGSTPAGGSANFAP